MLRANYLGNAMPTGPKGQKRPTDVIGNAVMVARIATGECHENSDSKSENAHKKPIGKNTPNLDDSTS